MNEETKEFIKQMQHDIGEILKYQNEEKVPCYEEMKTHEVVRKEDSIEYVCRKYGIHITPKPGQMQDQYKFLEVMRDWEFSGNWKEVLKRESDL